MQTVFITGAEGYLGSHLLEYLRDRGYDVVAGVRNRARKLSYERRNQRALVCDVADAINVARAIASIRPDAVVQLAGLATPTDALDEPLVAYQSMVTSCANVLDAVRRAVPRAKVVITSAADVYGNAGCDGQPISETTTTQPVTTFGSLKEAAESIAATFFRDYHLNVTVARPFQCLGGHMPERSLYGRLARQLAESDGGPAVTPFSSFEFGKRRDFLHVADAVTAFERLLQDGRPNETYNICLGEAVLTDEVCASLAGAFGIDASFSPESPPEDYVSISCLRGDSTKLRTELRWSPQHTLAQAVQDLAASARTTCAAAAAG